MSRSPKASQGRWRACGGWSSRSPSLPPAGHASWRRAPRTPSRRSAASAAWAWLLGIPVSGNTEDFGKPLQRKRLSQLGDDVLVGEHALLPNRLLARPDVDPAHPRQILALLWIVRVLAHVGRLERRL